MKKVFLIIVSLMLTTSIFAQVRQTVAVKAEQLQLQEGVQWDSNVPQECFCCNDKIYNLPKPPPINGPTVLKCTEKATFTTLKCEGATITWNVSPAVTFTGQGTSSITLIPPFSSTNYSISVTIRCGNKVVENKITVQVESDQKCVPNFKVLSITANTANSGYEVITQPSSGSGYWHYWELLQVSACSGGTVTGSAGGWNSMIDPTGAVSSSNPAITGGPSGYGYQYQGLAPGVCYTIVHYIYCCGQWKKHSSCFCTPTISAKKVYKTAELSFDEKTEDVLEKDLPKELKAKLKVIKGN